MIASWAHAQGLRWIEDESNDNLYFRRNHVRHRVLPAVTETFPGVVGVLAHTAALVGEQAQLLDRLAVIDGAACRDGGDASKKVGYLSVARLRQLPEPAVRNVLRLELHQAGVQIPSAGRLQTLSDQVMHAADDSRVFVRMGGIGVHVWRDRLWIDRALCGACPKPYPVTNGVVAWPDGTLRIREPLVGQKTLQVAPLGHGQRFQPKGRCRGSVTEFLREQGVPPWMRPRLPGLWSADHLVWVAGLGWADALPQTQAGDAVAWSVRPLVAL
jgi:tRNA(Ile)-lysidine synthase